MLNKVMIIGRLGRAPELRYTQSGIPFCVLSVATDEVYQDKDGHKVERTEWHRVHVFQRVAENCANYLTRGSLIYVEGSLQTRKWTDQQGVERSATDVKAQRVQFLDRKNDAARTGAAAGAEDSLAASPRRDLPPQQSAPRPQQKPRPQQMRDDSSGPIFPSEVSELDEVPF